MRKQGALAIPQGDRIKLIPVWMMPPTPPHPIDIIRSRDTQRLAQQGVTTVTVLRGFESASIYHLSAVLWVQYTIFQRGSNKDEF